MGGYDSFRPQTTNTNWHRFSCPECGKQCKICSESADYFDYSDRPKFWIKCSSCNFKTEKCSSIDEVENSKSFNKDDPWSEW